MALDTQRLTVLHLLFLLALANCQSTNSSNSTSLRVNTNVKAFDPLAQISGPDDAHVCTREEPYVEHVVVPVMQPVRVRISSWCLEIPPRCASYKTEMREVDTMQAYNKTRTVRFCCDGYEGNISIQAVCKPICRGGCGRGTCLTPDVCSCEEGYNGKHCTQRCDHDRWGLGCKNICECQNDAVCDNKSGICHCVSGWAGQFCEQPCPPGTHGIMCRKACECSDKLCHPQTGECISNHTQNVTHVMFERLNSSIANITHNLDHIAKKIGNLPDPDREATSTAHTLPEVILIKQPIEESQHPPKIILHQTDGDLLENLQPAATGTSKTKLLQVITSWPSNVTTSALNPHTNLSLAGLAASEVGDEHTKAAVENDNKLLLTLLIILLIILIAIIISFLYFYRRYHCQKQSEQLMLANGQASTLANGTGATKVSSIVSPLGPEVVLTEATLVKNFSKPLPQPPLPPRQTDAPHTLAHTHSFAHTEEVPVDLYDTPSNNSSIKTPPYGGERKESIYSTISQKSRKGSLDSHLYDEIRYHHQQQQQQLQKQHLLQQHSKLTHPHRAFQSVPTPTTRFQHATTAAAYLPPAIAPIHVKDTFHQHAHHVAHLIIPPQNSKFLQVPMSLGAPKLAHV